MRRTIRFVRLQSVVRFLDLAAGSSTAVTARLASLSPVSGSSSAWPRERLAVPAHSRLVLSGHLMAVGLPEPGQRCPG
ncbi:unnamed protein product [Macrosiphum euphorbiae]|uniref:Secreted protein n=1 Tax=Macrosiphum euphorbiae TaxID=13131 RepID=A0AAV0XWS6_9HEMI|nr:unnamed protein product [Macrosiphum euphorbiae]